MSLPEIAKNEGHFRGDEALLALLCLALNNICENWMIPIRDWNSAPNRFTIWFESGIRGRKKISPTQNYITPSDMGRFLYSRWQSDSTCYGRTKHGIIIADRRPQNG